MLSEPYILSSYDIVSTFLTAIIKYVCHGYTFTLYPSNVNSIQSVLIYLTGSVTVNEQAIIAKSNPPPPVVPLYDFH